MTACFGTLTKHFAVFLLRLSALGLPKIKLHIVVLSLCGLTCFGVRVKEIPTINVFWLTSFDSSFVSLRADG